jgi:hypothetical protein
MKKFITILFLFCSLIINAQSIDFNNFCEKTMNNVMFDEMNKYVKELHNGDSLTLSLELYWIASNQNQQPAIAHPSPQNKAIAPNQNQQTAINRTSLQPICN